MRKDYLICHEYGGLLVSDKFQAVDVFLALLKYEGIDEKFCNVVYMLDKYGEFVLPDTVTCIACI